MTNEQIDELLSELDQYAVDVDDYVYGLPMSAEHLANMRAIARMWLAAEHTGVENSPKTQRVYLDADVTPTEAATMLYAVYGPLYTDRLIDALIDVFEIQPATTDKSRTYDL